MTFYNQDDCLIGYIYGQNNCAVSLYKYVINRLHKFIRINWSSKNARSYVQQTPSTAQYTVTCTYLFHEPRVKVATLAREAIFLFKPPNHNWMNPLLTFQISTNCLHKLRRNIVLWNKYVAVCGGDVVCEMNCDHYSVILQFLLLSSSTQTGLCGPSTKYCGLYTWSVYNSRA